MQKHPSKLVESLSLVPEKKVLVKLLPSTTNYKADLPPGFYSRSLDMDILGDLLSFVQAHLEQLSQLQ